MRSFLIAKFLNPPSPPFFKGGKYRFSSYFKAELGGLLLFSCILAMTLPTVHCPLSTAFAADLGEITVTGGSEQVSEKAPSSFTTVVKPNERTDANKTAIELISEAPGVVAKQFGGAGQYSTVTIRGSSAEEVSVYIDGIKINSPTGGGVDFSSIPVEQIERIEVIRGGGTSEFGPDAIGGVINIITKKAEPGVQVAIKPSYGSFESFKTSESLTIGRESLDLVLSHTHSQSKGDYTFKSATAKLDGRQVSGGKTFTRLNNNFISEDGLAKLNVFPSDDSKIELVNDFYFTSRGIPGTEEETTVLYPTNPLDAHERIYRNISGAKFEQGGLFDGVLTTTLGLTNNFEYDKFTDKTPAIGAAIDIRTRTNTLSPNASAKAVFSNDHVTNSTTLRYDFEWDHLKDSSAYSSTPLTGSKGRYLNGMMLQDEVWLFKERFLITPSAVYERASDFGNGYGAKIGTEIKPVKFLTLKSNFQRSFRFPNFSELYYPDQGYIRGNPNLDAELAYNLDAGFHIDTPFAWCEAAYFWNNIKNQIIWVPVSATTVEPVNTFDAISKGVEVSAKATPVEPVQISGSYTWNDAKYKSSQQRLPGRPEHTANGKLSLSQKLGEAFSGGVYSSIQWTSSIPVNAQNTVFLAGRSNIDAGVSVRYAPQRSTIGYYTLNVDAKDITNVQIYDARGFPLPRRSFFVSLGYNWKSERAVGVASASEIK